MLLRVSILVDVDTTDTDIEDVRTAIVDEAMRTVFNQPELAVIEPVDPDFEPKGNQ